MEIESKLDEDFVFYLGFVNTNLKHITEANHKLKAEQWLQKLCGEVCQGVERKRCRNIYLSQLIICMQSGQLGPEFFVPLNEVDIMDAMNVFKLRGEIELTPTWLNDKDIEPETPDERKGRTYLATRTLPAGQGAFAYIAVSLDDQEPKWLGGGEGLFDKHMEEAYKEAVPEAAEMEKILARRKDPKEREKVVTFYTVLLENIEDELDEKIKPKLNKTINGLLEQLEHDLRDRGKFKKFETLNETDCRIELLILLHDRIKTRVGKVMQRELLLDEVERDMLAASFMETSTVETDVHQLPAAMWEQVINKAPNVKMIDQLKALYPIGVVEMFLRLLSNYKEGIAMRMQRRHENILAQLRKELRKEDDKGKRMKAEAKHACDHALDILKAVREAHQKVVDIEEKNKARTGLEQSEHSKLYDQMRAALCETQKSVEHEAARGRELAAQIHVVSEQTEMCAKVNEETIKKIELENMAIMRNIKKLSFVINQQEERIDKVKKTVSKKPQGEQFDIMF